MLIKRTTSDDADFQALANELELDLKIRDGDEHLFYARLNRIGKIKHVLVAYELDESVGCGALKNYSSDTMEVKRMYVRPANRKKGIASQLLNALENWGIKLGFKNCVLETGKNQPEAIAFYKKNGYEIIPNFGKYINSQNSICFKKLL